MQKRLSLLALIVLAVCASAAEGKRPNIIVILTDDQGYGDLSCHGHPVLKTPNIDRLHTEGVRFTDFHVSPTCAPTRSALLTGRHEFRNGITHTIYERERLRLDAVTLPQVLKRAGYRSGIFGKWHLGDEDDYQPGKRGFDEVFIHGAGGIGQSYPGSCGDVPGNRYQDPWVRHNGTFVKTEGYCTDVFFAQAMRWITADKGQPFFAWIATNTPHTPLQVRPEDEARYAGQVKPDLAKYLGMIANIDDNVGRLLNMLDSQNLTRDTLVIFMNDNGAWPMAAQLFNAGMRGHKNTAWIGGTRASSLWRWPGTLQPSDVPALTAHVDLFRTLAQLAGTQLTPAEEAQAEGRSLVPLLRDPVAPWAERTLFTHEGRWKPGTAPDTFKYRNCSVRSGRWQMITSSKDFTQPVWQLYDVVADPGQATDVAAAHPAVIATMSAAYEAWWKSVRPEMVNEDAKAPEKNPFAVAFSAQVGTGK